MTRKEREELRKVIRLLQQDDCWDEPMKILCRLAGVSTPKADAVESLRPVDIADIPRRDQAFCYRPDRKREASA